MKKYLFSAMAVVILAMALCVSTFAADVTVSTADELVAIMNDIDSWRNNITLTADIDLSGKEQRPIGTYDIPFTGTFDGAGFTIKGLDIATAATVHEGEGTVATTDDITAGLFGVVEGATIKNLTVEGKVTNNFVPANAETKIDGNHSATAGIVAVALMGTNLENLTNKAEVAGPCHVGGVAGILRNFDIDDENGTVVAVNCVNYGTLSPTLGNSGGVFGRLYVKSTVDGVAATIENCANYADVTSASIDRNRLAGIVGYIRSESGIIVITGCRNEGAITGLGGLNGEAEGSNRPYVGGMVGRIELTAATSALQLTNCVNTGAISSTYIGGGVAGLLTRGAAAIENPTVVENCLNTAVVDGDSYAAGIVGCSDCGAPEVAEGVDATPLLPKIVNNLNTGKVELGACSGGVISQAKNVYVANCVTLENNVCKVAATSVGTPVVENNYFLKGNLLDLNPIGTNTEMEFEKITDATVYTTLDFENVWAMGEVCPVLKNLASETVTVSAPFDVNSVINNVVKDVVEATETVSEVVTTNAPATEGGSPVGIIIAVIAVVVVVAAVVIVIVKKKK